MSNRKLINDMHKTHKKILEGVNDFSQLYEKAILITNNQQLQKLELDMKKEIKKLQRFRDQLKSWLNGNEVKDKSTILEDRKLIELQMEKFKSIEKELKTKAFSKEGLLLNINKVDPKQKQKQDTKQQITYFVDELEKQIEKLEAEIELLNLKKLKSNSEKATSEIKKIQHRLDQHKKHIIKLELILRLLENDKLEPENVNKIIDQVEYYVEYNQEPEFIEDDSFYEDLELGKEDELMFNIGLEENNTNEEMQKDKDTNSLEQRENSKQKPNETVTAYHKKISIEQRSTPNSNTDPPSAPVTREGSRRSTISKTVPTKITTNKVQTLSTPTTEEQKAPLETERNKMAKEVEPEPKKINEATPKCLEDMLITFNTLKDKSNSFDEDYYNKMINLSYTNIPEAFEAQDPKYYIPIEPLCYTPQYYPQIPYYQIENNEEIFEKLDLDTLFFIFYYEQNTLQQYYAVKELKKRAWRFHKKYLTWFQRHDEPKIVETDFEMGTYIFFDYESSWCKRKKSEFEFNYEYLEDTELE